MKIVQAVLVGILVALACGQQNQDESQYQIQGPWQQGKLYKYEVSSKTFANLKEGAKSGAATKATFLVRVTSPERLQAKLESVQHAQVHQELTNYELPQDMKYEPVQGFEDAFEVLVKGGRVEALNLPASMNQNNENMVKALVSSLQVDLTPYKKRHESQDYFDKETYQGQYRKMETDVTGDCETLYVVSPFPAERYHELPKDAKREDAIEITKTRNYGKCNHRLAYHFGVQVNAEWTGAAHSAEEYQLMKRATSYQIQASKQGPIYKSKAVSTVEISPLMRGQQKAEVRSEVKVKLVSLEDDAQPQWQMPENMRMVKNLLYSLTSKSAQIDDYSSTESKESQQQNSASNEEEEKQRIRRSPKFGYRAVSINKVVIEDHPWVKDRSSSSSSSSDSSSGYVNDETPKFNEPAYASLYLAPQQRADNKQAPMAAQKLAQEIAQQLNNPNTMPKADTLSKFNILSRVIASMSAEQLAQTSRGIEMAKASNNNVKSNIWMVFRDAVAQAGTMPAFQQIKSWILSKKLQGEEAAQVVASLATSLRYPTKEQMTQFFELATSEEVDKQAHLNSTALLAATRFINMGHVDEKMAHANYPTHMYGRLTNKNDQFVEKEIMPRLRKELDEAIESGNSHRAQVLVKAIGNLGHRATLGAFEPYLSGRKQASSYLRRFMVENLDVLAYRGDQYARAALYSIIRNTAEPNDVRVAAIHNIFMAGPTLAMMQTMAAMTDSDPSMNVRAAIKSSIETAAKLENPQYLKLSRTAKAAKELLTKKNLSPYYSAKYYYNAYDSEHELDLFGVLSYIRGENSMLPKNLKYSWASNPRGWNNKNTIAASFSNPRQFHEYFADQMHKGAGGQEQKDNNEGKQKYTPEKIAKMLNIQRNPQEPVEANFFIDLMGQQRFLPFSEVDMQRMPEDIQNHLEKLANGADYHYTKVLNQAQVSIMFPLANGMPFIFKYKEPTLVNIQGKAKAQVRASSSKPYSVSYDSEWQFTFARNLDGSVGFLDTLANQYSSVGVVSKLQVNIPIKAQIGYEQRKVKLHLEPLRPEQDATIAHYSVWPYSASQKKDSQATISLDPATKVISRPNKAASMDFKFGQPSTGTQFQYQGYSYSKDYRNAASMFHGKDLYSKAAFVMQQRDVALTHFNLRYLGKQSPNKGAVTITVSVEKTHGKPDPQPATPDSEARRRRDMLIRVSDMKAPKAQVVDISATFDGPQKAEYTLTAGICSSNIDTKVLYAVQANRNSDKQGKAQASIEGSLERPEYRVYDLKQLLSEEAKTKFNARISYGQNENTNAQIEGYLLRSQKAAEDFAKTPLAQQCNEEMAKNNYYQPACHDAYIEAQAPDYVKATVTYKDVSPQVKNMTYAAYRQARHAGFDYAEESVLRSAPEGKMEMEAHLSYDDQTYDAAVRSRAGDLRIEDAPIPKYARYLTSMYFPVIHMNQRAINSFTNGQYIPFCAVDGNRIKTFSNRTYSYDLSQAWHLVNLEDARNAGHQGRSQNRLVVLARRPSEKQLEAYISYSSPSGDIEIKMQPTPSADSKKGTVSISTELKPHTEFGHSIYWDEQLYGPALLSYTLPDGVMVIELDDHRYRVIYDGERLVVSGDNRNESEGICGRMSGEPADDYRTQYGFVDEPAQFGASYALADEDPKSQKLQQEAKAQAYQRQHQYTAILRSDPEWSKYNKRQPESETAKNIYKVRNYKQGPCQLEKQVQYYEENGQICISTTKVPSCNSNCSGQNYKVQGAQVICRPKADQDFRMYREQIRQGKNPEISGAAQPKQFRVPSACSQ